MANGECGLDSYIGFKIHCNASEWVHFIFFHPSKTTQTQRESDFSILFASLLFGRCAWSFKLNSFNCDSFLHDRNEFIQCFCLWLVFVRASVKLGHTSEELKVGGLHFRNRNWKSASTRDHQRESWSCNSTAAPQLKWKKGKNSTNWNSIEKKLVREKLFRNFCDPL